MSSDNKSTGGTVVGGADVGQYRVIQTHGAAVVTAASTNVGIGVTMDSAKTGESVGYVSAGPTKAIANGAIGAETPVMPAADGKIAPWTTGNVLLGRTGDVGAAADGDIVLIFLENIKRVVT